MIWLNGDWSTFERSILENIVDVGARDLRFENIHFACDSITDAGGRVFVRERTCYWIDSGENGVVCSECGLGSSVLVKYSHLNRYCAGCGAKVVQE